MAAADWRLLTGGPGLGITGLEVSPAGQLVWLERSLTAELYPGPHQAALRLMSLDQPGGAVREVRGSLNRSSAATWVAAESWPKARIEAALSKFVRQV